MKAIFGVAAIITTIILVVVLVGRDNCAVFQEPADVSILERTDDILLSWTHPPTNQECGVSYIIEYAIDNGDMKEVSTAGTSVTLPRPDACLSISFSLWAVNEAGERSNNFITRTYLVRPTEGGVTNITLLSTKAGLEVNWNRPTGLDNCNLKYEVSYFSDITGLETPEMVTPSESIVIPGNTYCFRVTVNIFTQVFEQDIPDSLRTAIFIDVVRDIDIQQSQEDINKIVVTWAEHPRHDECSLIYEVIYMIDDVDDGVVIQTQKFLATFPAHFCSYIIIMITALSSISSSKNMPVIVEKILDPIKLGPVQNADVIFTEVNEATISWYPPKHANQCNNLYYQVNALNDQTGEDSLCTGQTACTLSLSSYCPRTTFIIWEISGITEELSFDHSCNQLG